MKINLYYAPHPVQKFGDSKPVSTERNLNPKSALVTLASGFRLLSGELGLNCDIEIIDMQIEKNHTMYKSFKYGDENLFCYRSGKVFEEYDEKIRSANIHGISSNFTNGAQIVSDFSKYIKKVHPSAFIIIGGTDASARPEYYLKNGADVVIKGEGEYIFTKVVEAYCNKQNYSTIQNVCTLSGDLSDIIKTNFLMEMDTLEPMALDLVSDISIYNDTGEGAPPRQIKTPFVCFETSRGCYHKCSFCTIPLRGGYRFMSPDGVRKHFDYFKSKGIKTLLFQEDNILSRIHRNSRGELIHQHGREEIIEIFNMARDYGFSWEFANGLEFNKLYTNGKFDYGLSDVLFWNKKSDNEWLGCYRVQIPLESLRNRASEKFPKLAKFEQQVETLRMILSYGVTYHSYNVIIGYPDDSTEMLNDYLSKCFNIKDEMLKYDSNAMPYFNVFALTLLPGSQDFKKFKSRLNFDINLHPETISMYLPSINTKYFSYFDMFKTRLEMNRELNGDKIELYDQTY